MVQPTVLRYYYNIFAGQQHMNTLKKPDAKSTTSGASECQLFLEKYPLTSIPCLEQTRKVYTLLDYCIYTLSEGHVPQGTAILGQLYTLGNHL